MSTKTKIPPSIGYQEAWVFAYARVIDRNCDPDTIAAIVAKAAAALQGTPVDKYAAHAAPGTVDQQAYSQGLGEAHEFLTARVMGGLDDNAAGAALAAENDIHARLVELHPDIFKPRTEWKPAESQMPSHDEFAAVMGNFVAAVKRRDDAAKPARKGFFARFLGRR